ncbi:MAG: ABC transporter permease subunit [Chlamydiales bacterium]|nr:ABC transporter permease subunit [Chlamydiales bacterium]
MWQQRSKNIQSIVIQILVFSFLLTFIFLAFQNAYFELAKRGILPRFTFLFEAAGFDIGESFLAFNKNHSYLKTYTVGLINTLWVSAWAILFSSLLGGAIGIMRLSKNPLIRIISAVYIELFRNVPLLLLLIFLKIGVFTQLPHVKGALSFGGHLYFSNRGITLTTFQWENGGLFVFILLVLGFLCFYCIKKLSQAFLVSLAVLLVLFTIYALNGWVHLDKPELATFNFSGGLSITPEFFSLFLGLSIYTSTFIAETVRSGILSVAKGQREAALALGLSSSQTLWYIVMPQALRVIIPPSISHYLNLIKNSSLAAYIGYPELFSIGGTIFNQTGRSIELISLLMLTYLSFSLITSFLLNYYNEKVLLRKERT